MVLHYSLEEHKNKKLVPLDLKETTAVVSSLSEEGSKIFKESAQDKPGRKLIVEMEAIHVGRTRNYTFYTEEGLRNGLSSWTTPYNKPVLTHHNTYSGEPIGRIIDAKYSNETMSGIDGLVFTVEINDKDAIEKVLDKRYQTVSIGASTDKVTCNICGTDRTESWCSHYPGDTYDEQTCHFIIGTTLGKEVSYVNTPSDQNAGNRSVQVVDEEEVGSGGSKESESVNSKIFQIAEGLYQSSENPKLNIYEHLNDSVKDMLHLVANTTKEGESGMDEKKDVKPKNEEDLKEDLVGNETDLKKDGVTLESLQGIITNLVVEKEGMKKEIFQLNEENKDLQTRQVKLLKDAHLALAEKVIELKYSLNKHDVVGVDREEALQEHIKRTRESLEDSLNDLTAEAKSARVEPGSVKSPGATEEDLQDQKEDKMSVQEGINLMRGIFNRN